MERVKKRFLRYFDKERLSSLYRQLKWIYGYGVRYWKAMIFYTILGVAGAGITLVLSFLSRELVDILTGQGDGILWQTLALTIGLNLITTVVTQFSGYASKWISMKVNTEIKADIFSKILITDWECLTNYHTGDLLTRWSSDASNISVGVLNFIPNMIIYTFRFSSALIVVLYQDWTFALFAFLGMPISAIMSKTLMKRMINNNNKSAAMNAKMSGFNQETFSNIQTIKAFDMIDLYVKRLKNLQREAIDMKMSFHKISMKTTFFMTAVNLAISYSAYGWGIYRVVSGNITYGTMAMFLALSGSLTTAVNNLTSLIPTAIDLATSAGRLMDIVEMPHEDYSNNELVETFLQKNHETGICLHIKDLVYTYQNGTEVFKGANIEVNPRETVALVGPSGEGKTTMIRLILSLMQPKGGVAYLTGIEDILADYEEQIQQMEPEVLYEKCNAVRLSPSSRRLFSYVPQGNTMFSGTIAENMCNVKPTATEEEIIEVLKTACAWEFVEKLPKGIYSEIKERGGGFSEGQAQRLSIARALLRETPILLLDEATSALDVATERKVLRNIMQGTKPRTCIVTTHRPTVLEVCTRVYGIEDKKCKVLNEEDINQLINGY